MVGFNRRLAPLIQEARKALAGRTSPARHALPRQCRPGAEGELGAGAEGGGRIVGEVCHFVDTLACLADALPTDAQMVAAEGHPDAVSIQLGFADGSIGTIVYTSLGDPALPKEYLEAWTAGRAAAIDDFRTGRYTMDGQTRKVSHSAVRDKGFVGELRPPGVNPGRAAIADPPAGTRRDHAAYADTKRSR